MTTKFKPIAFGIHGHSDIGSLDAAVSPAGRIKTAKKLGRPADSLTDHGSMSGLVPHYFAGKKEGIQSIHGIELYLIDERRPPKQFKNGKVEPQYTHQTVLFKTEEAYRYFCKMTPVMEERAILKFGESKPLLYLKELEPIAGQIVLGSGCLVSHVGKNVNDWNLTPTERLEWTEKAYLDLKRLSGDTPLLVEIFPHATTHNWKKPKDQPGFFYPILEKNHVCSHECDGVEHVHDECGHLTVPIDLQKRHNLIMMHLAKKHGDLLVISEDSHLGSEEDYEIQLQRMNNGQEKWRFYNKYAMLETERWAEGLKKQLGISDYDIEAMVDNSYKALDFFSNYKIHTNKDGWFVPTAESVYGDLYKGKDSKEIVYELIKKHGRMPPTDHPDYPKYQERLNYEISVFADNGKVDLLPYFFPVEDVVEWAKQRGELTMSRGSAGGSLLVYLLNMSVTDPVRYNLPFERMITLGRIAANTMPDADTDWEDREPILQYLFDKYQDRCSLIGTELSIKLKTSILDSERAELGEVRKETSWMVKNLSNPPQGVDFNRWLYGYSDANGVHTKGFLEDENDMSAVSLKKWIGENPKIWSTVQKCLGITKTRGIHAGGVLITPEPVQNYCPVMITDKGPVSSLNMKWAEEVGLIKYDFLGVSTLKALGIAIRALRKDGIVDLSWGEFPHSEDVYKNIYHTGKLGGVFQVDTNSMRPFVNKIKPNSIKDISNLVALVRPGALDAPAPDPAQAANGMTAAEYFAEVHNGRLAPYYIHPDLEPILSETYGVMLFQEQTLQFFRDIVGYTFAEAEGARRAIGKKIQSELEKHYGPAREACQKRGWTEKQIEAIIDTINASARYSFNKAHSAAYAILSYNCAYIKYYWPQYYWLGMLSIVTDDHDYLKHYLTEAAPYVLGVDIMRSHPTEWTIEGNKVRAPLSLIKGCGGASVFKIRDIMRIPLHELRVKKMMGEKFDIEEDDGQSTDVG